MRTIWCFLAAAATVLAQPEEPMLRIEAGMHTAGISRIDVDGAGRFLVTASHDKTVRVWELPGGRLLHIIRPPAGAGFAGQMYSVAISPDGKAIAAGGSSGGADSQSIYIFDRESGALRRRIAGLPRVADHLAYSPNGCFLAATLSHGKGLRLYNAADYSPAGSDEGYDSGSGWAAFSSDSHRLITTSFDGFIRLYDVASGLRLLRKEKAPGGLPNGVAFSPDGRRIAVGYADAPRVDVLAGGDLSLLFFRSVVKPWVLDKVAWSRDGAYLFAGGLYRPGSDTSGTTIVRWNREGGDERQFPVQATAATLSVVSGLLPLPDGHLLFAFTDPGFGILDQRGQRVLWSGSAVADFMMSPVYASTDGLRVGFGYEILGRSPATFSISDRSLRLGTMPSSVLGPVTTGLNVTDWRGSSSPKLDGKPLRLHSSDSSLTMAIAPDHQFFVLGSSSYVSVFDSSGKSKWFVKAPEMVRAVNIPGDGRTVIAAFRDGTIRWYRADDGKELLAFFPAADRKRWVMWSPAGYYDASPGGEDLIGWQVGNGPDGAADFYPASRFRSLKYRPDVVARVLATRDESEALRLADADAGRRQNTQLVAAALPPVVRIVSPSDGAEVSSTDVTLQYGVRSAAGDPVSGVRVLLDGRPLPTARRIVRIGELPAGSVNVTIPERDCEISVIAENRNGASEAATVRLRWRGSGQFVIQPKLYILAIGISAYPNPWTLHMAARDAGGFVNSMKLQKGRLYRDVEVKLLTDRDATRDGILDGLEWISRSTTQHDVAMVFLSGHGDNDAHGTYYFMPVDFDAERLKRTALEFSQIKETVQNLAGKVLVFVDTCHSGNVMGGRTRGGAADINALVNELASAENGAVVFAASTGKQVAQERDEWGNGAFTKALLEGIGGQADYGHTGKITVNMLDLYISERVKELTQGQQTPSTTKPQTIADFPVAVR
jgi:WD40 repeat protein